MGPRREGHRRQSLTLNSLTSRIFSNGRGICYIYVLYATYHKPAGEVFWSSTRRCTFADAPYMGYCRLYGCGPGVRPRQEMASYIPYTLKPFTHKNANN